MSYRVVIDLKKINYTMTSDTKQQADGFTYECTHQAEVPDTKVLAATLRAWAHQLDPNTPATREY